MRSHTDDDDYPPSYRLEPIECPWCRAEISAATSAQNPGARPSTGDVSGCIECGEPAIFHEDKDGNLNLRRPSAFENVTIAAHHTIGPQVALIQRFVAQQKPDADRAPRRERRKKKKR